MLHARETLSEESIANVSAYETESRENTQGNICRAGKNSVMGYSPVEIASNKNGRIRIHFCSQLGYRQDDEERASKWRKMGTNVTQA